LGSGVGYVLGGIGAAFAALAFACHLRHLCVAVSGVGLLAGLDPAAISA
jgi:hypothetical protein